MNDRESIVAWLRKLQAERQTFVEEAKKSKYCYDDMVNLYQAWVDAIAFVAREINKGMDLVKNDD